MYNETDVYPYRREYKKTERKKRVKTTNKFGDYAGTKLGSAAGRLWQNLVGYFSFKGLFLVAAAFFLGRAVMLGELMPFGPAYLIAVTSVRRSSLPPVLIAVLVGMFTQLHGMLAWEHLFVMLLLTATGSLYPIKYERRWLVASLMAFVAIILVKGLWSIFSEATIYRWVTIIFEGVFAGALAAAFTLLLNALESKRGLRALAPEETLCLIIAVIGVLIGMGDIDMVSFSLQRLAGSFLVMLVALGGGAGAGAAAGTLVGIVPGITKIAAPAMAGAFALGGFLAGIFYDYGKLGVAGGYILGNMIFSVYLLDRAATITRFGEILIASAALLLVVPGWQKQLAGLFVSSRDAEIHTQLAGISGKKVRDLAKVFSELAGSFSETAGTTLETSLDDDMANIMDLIIDKVCNQCPMTNKCWRTDFYSTYKNLLRLFILAENNGRVSRKDISANINSRCTRAGEIATAVNFLLETYQVDRFWRRRLEESKDLVALQLSGIAEVMEKLVDSLMLEVEKRGDLEMVLARELSKEGVVYFELGVYRRGRKNLEINVKHRPCGGNELCRGKIVPVVSRVIGRPYAVDRRVCPIHSGAANCQLRLIPSWTYHLEIGIAQRAKKGTAICGDKVATLDLQEGKRALFISDGMGVGPKAAKESSVTVNLLYKLLETGFSTEVAVKTVNSIMAMRSTGDSFTTLDLAMVDLYSGECEFVKIGAAPSWIKRGHRLETISRGNLPIGILKNIEVESLKEELQLGDILVMASDGVLDQQAGEQGLMQALKEIKNDDPQRIAKMLLESTLKQNQGKAPDDITLLVARVDRNLLQA